MKILALTILLLMLCVVFAQDETKTVIGPTETSVQQTSQTGAIKVTVMDTSGRILTDENTIVSIYDLNGKFIASGNTQPGTAVFYNLPVDKYLAKASSGGTDGSEYFGIDAGAGGYVTVYLGKNPTQTALPAEPQPTNAVSTPATGQSAELYWRYAKLKCSDGYETSIGGPTSCKPKSAWSKYSDIECAQRNSKLQEFDVAESCSSFEEVPETTAVSTNIAPATAPICSNVGTTEEGWYAEGKLIKYDKCACTAVCQAVGSKSEGYYSSCSGELITWAKCAFTETVSAKIQNQEVWVQQNAETRVVEIKSQETAGTTEKIIVENEKIKLMTQEGPKEIKVLPEQAKQTVMDAGKISEVESIGINSETVNDEIVPIYLVYGAKKEYFLWIFPYDVETEVLVNAQTNEIIED